jgi:hypothetical protein
MPADNPITDEQLLKLLRDDIKKAGSRQAWLERHGYCESFLSTTLNRQRPIAPSIAEILGYERAWVKK